MGRQLSFSGLLLILAICSSSVTLPSEAGLVGNLVSNAWRTIQEVLLGRKLFSGASSTESERREVVGKRRLQVLDVNALPVPMMISAAGYPVETHSVTTDDGYILTVHRIPTRDASVAKGVVLLQHGILCSSADWVMGAPEKSLGYILSDAGYDVWMGNFRGNSYSRRHTKYKVNPNGPASSNDPFWSFSFHEMGVYDVPATIDYVLSATNRTRLDAYVGHSMGTTAFFVASHYYTEWIRDKVAVMVGLAPVARIDHLSSPIKHLIAAEPQVKFLLDNLGQGSAFWTQSSVQAKISRFLCDKSSGVESSGNALVSGGQLRRSERRKQKETSLVPSAACAIPENAIFIIAGFNQDQMNMTLLPRILGHTPSGTSFKTLEHYTQIYKTHRFSAFDYGSPLANLGRYSTPFPTPYSLSRCLVPSALMWGANDFVASPRDVLWLSRQLPNVVSVHRVAHPKFNHLDFLWAKDGDRLVYAHVLKAIRDQANNNQSG